MYNPTVGFAATRPTSGRLRLSPRAVSRTSASPSQLRHCTASALRQRLSSIPPPHASINIAGHPGLSIAIAATTPTASGHSAVSSIEARSTPASKAWWHPHIPVDDGRHRTTLNGLSPTMTTQLDPAPDLPNKLLALRSISCALRNSAFVRHFTVPSGRPNMSNLSSGSS